MDWQTIFNEYRPKIFRYLVRLVGSLEAEDLTQEVFLKAYENIEKFRGEAKVSSWLYRIAYNLSMNWSERRAGRETQLDDVLADNLPAPADASEELLEQQRQLALVKEALAGMPEKYRTVIDLYYFKERSYQEIADALAIPINTVKIRLLRAKERLRERSGGPE